MPEIAATAARFLKYTFCNDFLFGNSEPDARRLPHGRVFQQNLKVSYICCLYIYIYICVYIFLFEASKVPWDNYSYAYANIHIYI